MNKNKEALYACIDEFYLTGKGIFIERPDEIILQCGDGYMTRRHLKHIVEQRKDDHHTSEEIKKMLDDVSNIIQNFDFEIANSNRKYPGSVLRVKVFKSRERGAVVVMDAPINAKRPIITTYPYRLTFAYFLLLKKLHASAAGEAPGL
jgi:hypothetical protein